MNPNLQTVDADIERLRQALAATPADSPDRPRLLRELGDALAKRFFRFTRDLADLDASIVCYREVVAALAPGHADRALYLRALGNLLESRFERTGDPADQEASRSYHREAEAEEAATGVDRGRWIDAERELGQSPAAPPPAPAPPAQPVPAQPVPAQPVPAQPTPAKPAPPLPPLGGQPLPPADGPLTPGGAPGRPGGAPGGRSDAPRPSPAPPVPVPAPAYEAPPSYGAPPEEYARSRAGAAPDARLEFAAAYRRTVEQERSYPFLFVIHRPADRELVRALIERRAPQLGGAPEVSQGAAAKEVRSGTTLTIVPNVIGATFEPGRVEVVVGDSLQELAFRVSVPRETPPGPIDGYIDIFVGPLIIGQVAVAFDVVPAKAAEPEPTPATKLMEIANASIFDKIFVSYSQRDSSVIDLCVQTYQRLGVTVLLDRLELRSGDDWRATLAGLIEQADIFQLYWSTAAAASSEVEHEWRMALGLGKTRSRFIRPLYWETPLPPIPEPLRHLHFSRLDLKQLRKAAKAFDTDRPGFLRRALAALVPGR